MPSPSYADSLTLNIISKPIFRKLAKQVGIDADRLIYIKIDLYSAIADGAAGLPDLNQEVNIKRPLKASV